MAVDWFFNRLSLRLNARCNVTLSPKGRDLGQIER